MKTVSTNRLLRRGGVYYYRRRVPLHLVTAIGRKFVQCSLGTSNATEAKKLRTTKDLEWDARFADCTKKLGQPNGAAVPANAAPLSDHELAELVRGYVEQMD